MTAHLYGWADLDAANRKHYEAKGNRKPPQVIRAEHDVELAWNKYEKYCNEYFDFHFGEDEYETTMHLLKDAAEAASDQLDRVRSQYRGG